MAIRQMPTISLILLYGIETPFPQVDPIISHHTGRDYFYIITSLLGVQSLVVVQRWILHYDRNLRGARCAPLWSVNPWEMGIRQFLTPLFGDLVGEEAHQHQKEAEDHHICTAGNSDAERQILGQRRVKQNDVQNHIIDAKHQPESFVTHLDSQLFQ